MFFLFCGECISCVPFVTTASEFAHSRHQLFHLNVIWKPEFQSVDTHFREESILFFVFLSIMVCVVNIHFVCYDVI